MESRITIKDIARELKVHHSTVSRALRFDSRVKPETQKLIADYAKVHGYQVNMSALQLRGTVKNVIAVVVPNINHQFFSNIISHLTNIANHNGYVVSIFQSNENVEHEKDIIETIIKNNVAGVIASISMETTKGKHFKELYRYNIPLVFFDRVVDLPNVPRVTVNNFDIVVDAVNQLIRNGYRRIAHVTGTTSINVFRDRQNGYSHSIKKLELPYHNIHQIIKGFTVEHGKEVAEKLFASDDRPDAIICDSDNLLLGIISKLHDMGLVIPKDVGLIGFGDNPAMEVSRPSITIIKQPVESIASEVYKLLIHSIENPGKTNRMDTILPAKIIERGSS